MMATPGLLKISKQLPYIKKNLFSSPTKVQGLGMSRYTIDLFLIFGLICFYQKVQEPETTTEFYFLKNFAEREMGEQSLWVKFELLSK